jgi:hypothetical protein
MRLERELAWPLHPTAGAIQKKLDLEGIQMSLTKDDLLEFVPRLKLSEGLRKLISEQKPRILAALKFDARRREELEINNTALHSALNHAFPDCKAMLKQRRAAAPPRGDRAHRAFPVGHLSAGTAWPVPATRGTGPESKRVALQRSGRMDCCTDRSKPGRLPKRCVMSTAPCKVPGFERAANRKEGTPP